MACRLVTEPRSSYQKFFSELKSSPRKGLISFRTCIWALAILYGSPYRRFSCSKARKYKLGSLRVLPRLARTLGSNICLKTPILSALLGTTSWTRLLNAAMNSIHCRGSPLNFGNSKWGISDAIHGAPTCDPVTTGGAPWQFSSSSIHASADGCLNLDHLASPLFGPVAFEVLEVGEAGFDSTSSSLSTPAKLNSREISRRLARVSDSLRARCSVTCWRRIFNFFSSICSSRSSSASFAKSSVNWCRVRSVFH